MTSSSRKARARRGGGRQERVEPAGGTINTLNDWVYKGVRSPGKKKKPGSYEELERSYNALVEKQKETEKKLAASERRNADLADKVEILQDCIKFFENERNGSDDR